MHRVSEWSGSSRKGSDDFQLLWFFNPHNELVDKEEIIWYIWSIDDFGEIAKDGFFERIIMLVEFSIVALQEGYDFGYVELSLELLLFYGQFLDLLLEFLLLFPFVLWSIILFFLFKLLRLFYFFRVVIIQPLWFVEAYQDKGNEGCEDIVVHVAWYIMIEFFLLYLQDLIIILSAKPIRVVYLRLLQIFYRL